MKFLNRKLNWKQSERIGNSVYSYQDAIEYFDKKGVSFHMNIKFPDEYISSVMHGEHILFTSKMHDTDVKAMNESMKYVSDNLDNKIFITILNKI